MEKATAMIAAKGYKWSEANDLAMQCFDNMEKSKNGMPVEWYIEKIADKEPCI
jgi:citrate synthase